MPGFWDWLMWGKATAPKPKHLQEILDRLLGASYASGAAADSDEPFPLPEREIKRLCGAAREALLKDSTLVEIKTSSDVVVVGDLHGQFGDLQRIFQRLGRPGSDSKVWVFLGDYIDRGPMGLEIVATLLALKLRHPNHIYLLRGNHECSEITVLFGFCGECQRRSTLAVWESVMQVFDALPLAALLNNQVFLCHGGISPQLQRPQDVNFIQRPLDVNPNAEGLLADLLWADPSPYINGWSPNPRGVSFVFGLDVARSWMRQHALRAIVRAHMVQQRGYEVLGNNEVMTVFSASDYRDSGNTGAVLVVAATLDFEFVTFPAQRPAAPESPTADAQAAAEVAENRHFVEAEQQAGGHLVAVAGRRRAPAVIRPSPFASTNPAAAAAAGEAAAQAAGQVAPEPAVPSVAPSPAPPPVQPPPQPPEQQSAAAAQVLPSTAALLEEVEEESVVMKRVESDKGLADIVRKGSKGLPELEQLTGGSRVPAEALARSASCSSNQEV